LHAAKETRRAVEVAPRRRIASEVLGMVPEPLFQTRSPVSSQTAHDLRHSVATLLADEKINTKVTAELLGHSDPAFTMRQYVHSTPDVQREAAELIGDVLQSGLKQVQEGG